MSGHGRCLGAAASLYTVETQVLLLGAVVRQMV